jgi:hypothetical protein
MIQRAPAEVRTGASFEAASRRLRTSEERRPQAIPSERRALWLTTRRTQAAGAPVANPPASTSRAA